MIDYNSEFFYVLVEGEPHSPEISFFNEIIRKIFIRSNISFLLRVMEVGGSSSFKPFAKFCYQNSIVHEKIPVLALSDNDYRISLGKEQRQDKSLIKTKEPKIIYWKRHEWENYLLDETHLIAAYINQLPDKKIDTVKSKPSKNPELKITKEEIDTELSNYFKEQLQNEFWECLKFNLSRKIKKYPSINQPDDFKEWPLEKIERWFSELSIETEDIFELKELPSDLFQTIIKNFNWEQIINSPSNLTLEHAKKYFRGKEAFKHLYNFICKKVEIHNLPEEDLKESILIKLMDSKSSIYSDLKELLVNEVRNIKEQ